MKKYCVLVLCSTLHQYIHNQTFEFLKININIPDNRQFKYLLLWI